MEKIAAIIVTFNRKKLLLRCIGSIVNQSRRPDLIIIVDNASTDGTVQFVESNRMKEWGDVKIIALTENVGGAGGFCAGIEMAIEEGCDWMWMMDDDGYAETNCLQDLMQYVICQQMNAISPLVIEIEEHKVNSFPFAYKDLGFNINEIKKIKFIPKEAHLFNGFLVSKDVFLKIGLPRKELFIRGDEVEFCGRMLRYGVEFGTLTSAIFFHPTDKGERFRLLWGTMSARCTESNFKNYYLYRNKAVAMRENNMSFLIFLELIKYFYFFIFFRMGDVSGFRLWIEATMDGIFGRLGRSGKY